MTVLQRRRNIRRCIRKFNKEPSFENWYGIRYYCGTAWRGLPCVVSENEVWAVNCGTAETCPRCPLNIYRENRTPVSLPTGCIVYCSFSPLTNVVEIWEKYQGELVIAFTRFAMGFKRQDKGGDRWTKNSMQKT